MPLGKRHRDAHAGHTAAIKTLFRHVDALSAQNQEASDASEARDDAATASIKALEAKVAALEKQIRAAVSRPSVAAESTAPPDVIKPAVKRATSRAKTASNGETGAATATAKGSGTP